MGEESRQGKGQKEGGWREGRNVDKRRTRRKRRKVGEGEGREV